MGWDGVIRGRRVVNLVSFSSRLLVYCSSLLIWSIGFYVFILLHLICRRMLFRGLLGCWVMWLLSGFMFNLGDIRQAWLGGVSFRCIPTCSYTPMPETSIGLRNLGAGLNFLYRWGWARKTTGVSCIPLSTGMGSMRRCWRRNSQQVLDNGCRGNMVKIIFGLLNFAYGIPPEFNKINNHGDNFSLAWICFVLLNYLWDNNNYGRILVITGCPYMLTYTGTLFWFGLNLWFLTGDWAVLWILWFWPQYKLRIQQTIAMVWYRGNFVLLDWFKNSLVVLVALNSLNELWYNLCGVCNCSDVLFGSMRLLFGPQSLLMVLIKVCRGKVVQCPAVIVKVPKRLMVVLLDLLGSISNVSWKLHGLVSVNLLAGSVICLCLLCSSKAEAHKFNIKSGYYLEAQIWTGSVSHVAQSWILIVFLIKLKTWACSVYMGPSLVLQLKARVWVTKVHMVMLSLLKAHVWTIRWLHGLMKTEDSRLIHKGHFSVRSGSIWIAWIKYVWAARFYGPRCGVKHYRKFCNLDRIGKYMSLSQWDFRFFCNPKRGCMVSYFWSPKHVLGMIRGNAPLMM
ncbi:hypothetical protein Hanom_Chr02g00095281 [Helianthus anomalus]